MTIQPETPVCGDTSMACEGKTAPASARMEQTQTPPNHTSCASSSTTSVIDHLAYHHIIDAIFLFAVTELYLL